MTAKIISEEVICDLCGSDKKAFLFRSRDFRYGNTDWFDFVKCKNCGLIYLDPRPTKESILSIYFKNYNRIKKIDIENSKRNQRLKNKLRPIWYRFTGFYSIYDLKDKGKLLDIGCGCGDTLEFAKDIGFEAYGIELNPKMIKICKEKKLNVYDYSTEHTQFSENMFDVIWMSQVIEHLPSPRKTLKEMKRILKPSGHLFIFCPNADSFLIRLFGKYWHGWFIPFHFYVFNEKTVRFLASKTGFKIETIKTSTPDSHFIVSLKSFLWGKAKNRKRPVDKGWILDTLLTRALISLYLRPFDLFFQGQGDCIKVILK